VNALREVIHIALMRFIRVSLFGATVEGLGGREDKYRLFAFSPPATAGFVKKGPLRGPEGMPVTHPRSSALVPLGTTIATRLAKLE
jgi:hypothetical protein